MSGFSRRFLSGFMAIGILAGTSNGIAKVALPLFAASLHATPWQIGLVGGLQFVGMILLSLPVGALIDRYGSRPLFRIGCVGGAMLFLFGLSFTSATWQLMLGVTLFGFLNPFRMVTTQTEFLHLLPQMGPARAGWQRAAHTFGLFFAGPMLGAFLITHFGFSDTFKLVAAGLLFTVIIGDRVFSSLPVGHSSAVIPLRRRLRAQFDVVRSRGDLRRVMAIEFLGQVAMSYFTVFVILLAIRQFHMPLQDAAGLVTLQGGLFVLTLLCGGRLLARWEESLRYALAFAVLLTSQLLLATAMSPQCLWAGAALLGVGLGFQHLSSVTRFALLTQELGRGRVGGLFSLAGPSGNLVGAVAGGLLSQRFGMLSGFRMLVMVFILQLGWQIRQMLILRSERSAALS